MEKLVLIDGNSLINRAFYAMPLLLTKNGTPTNAVYGFMNMFFKMLSDVKPAYAAVAFDVKAPTFRHELFGEYKGTRKPMPDELRPQIPLLKEVLNVMGVRTVEKAGWEADDIIGTIAKSTDIPTVIYTGDKDSFQLVDDNTSVCFTRRGITETEIYTAENFKEKTGISPSQVIELKALMGDSSDNIPGVAGVGEKTAIALLQTYGDIDNLYRHTDELKGKLKEKIENGREQAYMSRTLATIRLDCDVDADLESMRIKSVFPSELRKKFLELEFKTFVQRDDLFESAPEKEKADVAEELPEAEFIEITEADKFSEIDLSRIQSVVIDRDYINLYGNGKEYSIRLRRTLIDDGVGEEEALAAIKGIFCGNGRLVVYDKKSLRHYLKEHADIELGCPCEDVALMKYLVDYTGGSEQLKDLLEEYGDNPGLPAAALYRRFTAFNDALIKDGSDKLYRDIELPLSDVLYDMEVSGFKVDVKSMNETGRKYGLVLAELESKIRELAGDDTLNVNSPKQLGDLLFGKLKIGKGKKTKKGFSTSAEILESYEDQHPVIPLILRYRQIQKLQSTYIEGFKPLIDGKTGLIHTSFNQTVTATGRLSSKEPNLQNIPVRDDEGKEIRRFFVPKSADRLLVGADYSQIELRLLAAFSGCKALINAFKEGDDVHAETAAKVFGVRKADVTPVMRRSAKAVNFGIIYGISEYGLAKNLKISNAQAREYISAYFKEYPEVKEYMDKNVAFAKANGYAVTMFGRKRYIRELSSSNYNTRQFGERVAMNMPLQGSSADIIKVAMINVHRRFKEENLRSELILQVHDELIADAFENEKDKVLEILIHEMENAVELPVKLTVEPGWGKTWFDAK